MRKEVVDTAGKTETFFTRNVRLITFLICIAVFFALFGPISVFQIHRYIQENRVDPRPRMTVEEVSDVADRANNLRMSEFDKYAGTLEEGEMGDVQYALYRLPVDETYRLSVGFDKQTGKLFYLTLADTVRYEKLDLFLQD